MGFGLQCWDANGKMVVDTSDYNCRYLGTFSVKMPPGATSVSQSVPGVTLGNSFAAITKASYGSGFIMAYCVMGNNIFTLYSSDGYHTDETFTVEVYRYG
ncbi:hypothetical protein [Klebsiella grimontii]|uniref:hypothetical protein n=1 Tax=Klebsiella grimontii TaxID=2058152 RepID=UPI0012B7C452|nr:hypothetical protein [Klebsiella grimontii]